MTKLMVYKTLLSDKHSAFLPAIGSSSTENAAALESAAEQEM